MPKKNSSSVPLVAVLLVVSVLALISTRSQIQASPLEVVQSSTTQSCTLTMTVTLTSGQPYPPLAVPLPGSCYAFASADQQTTVYNTYSSISTGTSQATCTTTWTHTGGYLPVPSGVCQELVQEQATTHNTYGSSSPITIDGYYHFSYIPSGAQVFWLVADSGQNYRLIFAGGRSPNLPSGSPLPDVSHVTVSGMLTVPSAINGYDGDIVVSPSAGICYLTSSSGQISPCLHGTCDPSRGIYCPTPTQTTTSSYAWMTTWSQTWTRLWNWLRCLLGYC